MLAGQVQRSARERRKVDLVVLRGDEELEFSVKPVQRPLDMPADGGVMPFWRPPGMPGFPGQAMPRGAEDGFFSGDEFPGWELHRPEGIDRSSQDAEMREQVRALREELRRTREEVQTQLDELRGKLQQSGELRDDEKSETKPNKSADETTIDL
jgi:hypothetical protein